MTRTQPRTLSPTLLRVREFSQDLANDGEWHDVEFVPPAVVFGDAGSLEANSLMLYFGLEPPADGAVGAPRR